MMFFILYQCEAHCISLCPLLCLSLSVAKRSPLARKLFLVKGVRVVFFASDYVSITIDDEDKWPLLKPSIFAAIMDFFDSGEPLMLPETEVLGALFFFNMYVLVSGAYR